MKHTTSYISYLKLFDELAVSKIRKFYTLIAHTALIM